MYSMMTIANNTVLYIYKFLVDFKSSHYKKKILHVSMPFSLNELPVQVRCTILDAWGWCIGTTQRDGTGREEGGGFRMGNTCIPVADSF